MEPYQKPISDAQRPHQHPPQNNRDDMEDPFDEDMLDVSSRENTNTNDELTEYLGTSKRHETLSVNLSLLIMRCRPKENHSANLLERSTSMRISNTGKGCTGYFLYSCNWCRRQACIQLGSRCLSLSPGITECRNNPRYYDIPMHLILRQAG